MVHFKNKTVIITGAGGGIGRCHALAFAKEGANVVVNDLGGARDGSNPDEGTAATVVEEIHRAGGTAVADAHSVSEKAGAKAIIQTAIETFGGVDVLVNNAGILHDRTIAKMSEEEWEAVINVHLRGTYLCTQAACQQMIAQGRSGVIVNTSSTSGLFGNFGPGNYGAAKAGIAGFTKVAALEMLKHGIRVNAIAPTAKTRMTDDIAQVPEALKPEHISPLVLYLASDLAAGITGRIFAAQGNYLQEFYYAATRGVKKEGSEVWTLDEIAAQWEAITNRSLTPATHDDLAKLDQLLTLGLPQKFDPAKAGELKSGIYFHVTDGTDYTILIESGNIRALPGRKGVPAAVISGDARTIYNVFTGQEDMPAAYRSGRIKITNIGEVMRMQQIFFS